MTIYNVINRDSGQLVKICTKEELNRIGFKSDNYIIEERGE